MPLVVRTWNLYHGNTVPRQRRAFLREMVELVSADDPAVVCLQELPVWAVPRLEAWSGMRAAAAVARAPRVGNAGLGRRLTDFHHGHLRSAVTGQANAILVARRFAVVDEHTVVVSSFGERRVCQGLRLDSGAVVVNFHVTGGAPADTQFRTVADFAETLDADATVLAGDANLQPGEGATYALLRERGFSEPLSGSIDQILVRGLQSTAPHAWPPDRRFRGGRLLSDHAPVELSIG